MTTTKQPPIPSEPKTIIFNGENLYHTLKRTEDHNFEVTGYSPEDINPGDELSINRMNYEVLKVERRDHKGVFKNKLKNLNSFFHATVKIKK